MTSTHPAIHETHLGVVAHESPALEASAMAPVEPAPAVPPALAAVLRIDRRVWLGGGAIVGVGALVAAGVPPFTLLPLGAVGACLAMHLFMGHGGHAGHAGHAATPRGGQAGPPSADGH